MSTLFSKLASKRITEGAEEIYHLNGEPEELFVKEHKEKDIFFTKDGQAHCTGRGYNLIAHGKGGKFAHEEDVKFVYAGLEKEFYKLQDFKKLLKSVYYGRKTRGLKPIYKLKD